MPATWLIMILFSGGLLGQQLEAPPRDLASLLDPQAALQQMEAPIDEAGLIALLTEEAAVAPEEVALRKAVADLAAADFKTRQAAAEVLKAAGTAARPFLEEAAKADDPEVSLTARRLLEGLKDAAEVKQRADMDYVKKLMAVRLLQKTKSRAALPTLKKLTMTDAPTLADAAREAVAVIEGGPAPRPSGQDALKAICAKLPADVAFLALMNVERGAKVQSLTEVAAAVKAMLANPAIAPMVAMMGEGNNVGAMIDQMLPKAREGIIEALAQVGNVRVDAVGMVIPDNLDTSSESVYIAWVLKGLWEPKRLAALCETNRQFQENKREVAGHTFYVDRHDMGVCMLDEHTMVLAVFPGRGTRVDGLISALASEETGKLPAIPAQALETIKNKDVRIAVASSQPCGMEIQTEGREELAAQIQRTQAREGFAQRPDRQLEVAAMQLVLAVLDMEQLIGHMTTKGDVVLHGTSVDEKAAEALDSALKAVDEKLRAPFSQQVERAPDAMKAMLARLTKEALWTTERDGKQVTARANLLKRLNLLPMLLGVKRSVRAVARPGRPAPMPPDIIDIE